MLQNIRDNIQGTVAKVIMALIVIPFAVFGVDAFFRGGVPEVARVNGQAITEPELAHGIELERRRLLGKMQDKVDANQLDEGRLREPVLESLIERKLLGQAAQRAGFVVGDATVNQIIIDTESFHENGVFSQARFQGILASNGISAGQFRDMVREDVLISQVLDGIGASEFVTGLELSEVARLTEQSLDVRYLVVPLSGVESGVVVPEERIAEYFEENKSEFRTEETVTVDFLELKLEDLYQPVDEQVLRQEYERRMTGFKGAGERRAAHIMISSLPDSQAQERLEALRKRVAAGEDFAALARDNSEDVGSAANGGDLGFSKGDAFPPEFEEALNSLDPGEVSAPVKTGSGWHLVKLVEVRQEKAPSFGEMRAELERDLQRQAAEPLFVSRSEQLADLTFNSDDLSEASRELGLELQHSAPFGRRGGEGLFSDARVIAAAFGTEVLENAQNSERIELGNDHVVVLRVARHDPSRQQELGEVRERIRDLLAEAMVREKAQARGQALLAQLADGKTIGELAKAGGFESKSLQRAGRATTELPRELGRALFSAPRDENGAGSGTAVTGGGDVIVFAFDNFREGSVADLKPDERTLMARLLAKSRGREVVADYEKSLRDGADIRKH